MTEGTWDTGLGEDATVDAIADAVADGDPGGGDLHGTATAGDGSSGLDDIRRLRATARRDRQEWPFALVVLGLVVMLAAPFYVFPAPASTSGSFSLRVSDALGPLAGIGPPFAVLGQWTGLYWVVALVAAGLVVAVHYRRAAARRGIAGPLWPFVLAGIVMLAALVLAVPRLLFFLVRTATPTVGLALLSTAAPPVAMTLWMRGLTPLLVIGVAVLVLSWTERSAPLAVIGVGYLALAIAANVYNLSDLDQAGLPFSGRYDMLPNVLLPGVALLVAGLVAAAVMRHRAR